jgi:hypothetical protein
MGLLQLSNHEFGQFDRLLDPKTEKDWRECDEIFVSELKQTPGWT